MGVSATDQAAVAILRCAVRLAPPAHHVLPHHRRAAVPAPGDAEPRHDPSNLPPPAPPVALPVVVDIGLDPVAVGALGAQRIVGHAHALADAIHKAGLMGCRVGCRVAFDGCRHGAVSWLWRNVIRQNPLLNWSYASPNSPRSMAASISCTFTCAPSAFAVWMPYRFRSLSSICPSRWRAAFTRSSVVVTCHNHPHAIAAALLHASSCTSSPPLPCLS